MAGGTRKARQYGTNAGMELCECEVAERLNSVEDTSVCRHPYPDATDRIVSAA